MNETFSHRGQFKNLFDMVALAAYSTDRAVMEHEVLCVTRSARAPRRDGPPCRRQAEPGQC